MAVAAALAPTSSVADEVLGVPLPAWPIGHVLASGYPEWAHTWTTPWIATQAGRVATWKAQFIAGREPAGCWIPSRIQLKVLRPSSDTTLQVVAQGAVHSPRAILEARFGRECPGFTYGSPESVVEFAEAGVPLEPGDVVGVMMGTEKVVELQGYVFPGVDVSPITTYYVGRDVPVGGTIDLPDIWTGKWTRTLPLEIAAVAAAIDADGDGVEDAADACRGTAPGAVVDAAGCSLDDLCPCVAPAAWRNHGAYVSCVAHAAEGFLAAGVIDAAEKDAAVSTAARSRCGAKR